LRSAGGRLNEITVLDTPFARSSPNNAKRTLLGPCWDSTVGKM
jgi:hypothetical protein